MYAKRESPDTDNNTAEMAARTKTALQNDQ